MHDLIHVDQPSSPRRDAVLGACASQQTGQKRLAPPLAHLAPPPLGFPLPPLPLALPPLGGSLKPCGHASSCTTPGVPVSPPARHRSPLPMQVDRPGPWITTDTKILMSTPGPLSLWQGWLTTSRGGSFMDAAGHHMRTGLIAKSAVDVTLGTSGSKTTCPARGGPPLSWGLELHAPERAHANAKMHVSNTDAP